MIAEDTTTKNSLPIQFTESALKEIAKLAANEKGKALRVGVKNGGCSGFSYIFEFDEATESDAIYSMDVCEVVIDKMHLLHLQNVSVHYENGLNNRGFTFTNPNASETCGCGTSFS